MLSVNTKYTQNHLIYEYNLTFFFQSHFIVEFYIARLFDDGNANLINVYGDLVYACSFICDLSASKRFASAEMRADFGLHNDMKWLHMHSNYDVCSAWANVYIICLQKRVYDLHYV